MIFWMGYAAVVGLLLAAGGWAGERLCETMGWPRRFPWIAALTLAVVIPLSARAPTPVFEMPAPAPSAITSVVGAAGESVSPSPGSGLERAALVAWGAASLATLAAFGAILGLMACSRRRWPRRSVDGEDVYVSEGFGPALIGVTRPSVVIPEWLFCASARAGSVAILHEREHARARDHLTLLYGAVIAALFPWSPAVWWMVRNLRGAVEIDCDRRVIATGITPGDYGRLLLAIGVGQHRRWVFTPALVESRHSLERRLKIMAAKKMKWSPLRAVTLAGLTLAAAVMACDTEAPTGINDALVEVLASPEAAAGEDGTRPASSARDFLIERTNDGPQPLIFIDGVEMTNVKMMNSDVPGRSSLNSSDPYSSLNSLNPDDIERIEVIKGAAAADLFGNRAEGGVIQIFVKLPQPREPVEPSRNDPGF